MKWMTATFLTLVAAVSVVLLHTSAGRADKDAKAEEELIKLENDWAQAFVKKDVAFFERVEADEYTFTDPSGTVFGKKEDVAGLKDGVVAFESMKLDDLKVRLYGEVAVVTGRATIQGKIKDQDVSGQYRATDVFVKRDGRWQCVAAQATRIAKP